VATQGRINAEQFKTVAAELGENLTDEEVDKIFQKADLDQDGYITAEDFYTVMSHRSAGFE
jgi:Ca2+-binding EF-hand superfamily protein